MSYQTNDCYAGIKTAETVGFDEIRKMKNEKWFSRNFQDR